jgi:hypothetical protein
LGSHIVDRDDDPEREDRVDNGVGAVLGLTTADGVAQGIDVGEEIEAQHHAAEDDVRKDVEGAPGPGDESGDDAENQDDQAERAEDTV